MVNGQQVHNPDAQKVIRLIEYLSRLATLRTKIIRDIDEYQKVLWISDLPHEQECFTQAWGSDEDHESDEWLEVKKRREPALPAIPPASKDWVNLSTLRSKNDLPELLPQIRRLIENPDWCEGSDQPETIPHIEHLEDHQEIMQAWINYVEEKWLPWTEEHNEWEKVHKVYSTLFAIYQEQLRLGEEYELVLGLGLLTWQTPTGQRVRRHLIVADAILEFEARLSKFTVRPNTEGAKVRLELDMMDVEDQPVRAGEAAKSSLAAAEDNPWEKGCIEGVLQALVHSIDSQGDYDDSLKAKPTHVSTKPIVEYAPALILRKRSARGLTESLNQIKKNIEAGGSPGEFAGLAEICREDGLELTDGPEESRETFDGEIFFPKPSNDEQRRIVAKVRTASGVLVQGPPGTGKSHTIANLVSHLLATGQRILVTAKTPRALQVLMGKPGDVDPHESDRNQGLIHKEIRPLCISLLGSGIEERKSLESSVGGILRKNEEWNECRATRERSELEGCLRKLREERAEVTRRLRDIRESETFSQTIAEGAYRGTAARIAEAVNRDRAAYEWFTDSVPMDQNYQALTIEIRNVLAALRQFTPEKRKELTLSWPESLPSHERMAILVGNETSAIEEEQNSAHGADEHIADLLTRGDSQSIEAIRDAFSAFRDTCRRLLSTTHPWMSEALRNILGGNSSVWHELLRITRDVIASFEKLIAVADETQVYSPPLTNARLLRDAARKLEAHIKNGGKLGWAFFRPKQVKERLYVIKDVRINGRPCSTANDFSTLADALHVQIQSEKAWGFWKGITQPIEGSFALQLTALKSLCDTLENALALEERIAKCREALKQCPDMPEPIWADNSKIEIIISSCRLALARIRRRDAVNEIQSVEDSISRMVARSDTHPITNDLLGAIRSRDLDEMARHMNTILDLEKQYQGIKVLDENLLNLRHVLPQLMKSLEQTCNEPYWEERIQHIGDAWHWAQARYWIEEYLRKDDVSGLSRRAKQIEDEINSIIAKLAALHAWSFCFSRLKEDHRRHMEAWQQSMRRLGKGTGKHASHHRRQAQVHLNACREAVPAWVMPLHRIWDTVNPAPGMFDVIIIDEASQCGFEALPLFYLGKKILIVGDDKQISPDAVGLPRSSVHHLMEEFLYDFGFKSSFDVESSLFDHGKLRYGTRRITLREHFRCMPEIIRFSNDLCYSDTPLIPLRQYGPNRLPPLDHVFVSNGHREGSNNRAINRPEADAIVKRVIEMCGDRRYDGKTMGVVILQGEAQATLIENQLLEQLGAEEMENRRLVCGNPYSFQGDERDIMFMSLVAASNERIGPLTKAADERRFNVAASRARDMMVLFHSVTVDDLSNSCLRRRLLQFFENTKPQQIAGIERDELERRAASDNRRLVKPPTPFESWFEVDVALELLRRNYTVLAQHEVAGKRIDLVVEGGQARLAIECDGDSWHGAERYEDDMQRQRQLERCRWEFYRVRESAFYTNKVDALSGLWGMLEERGIFPNSQYDDHSREEDLKGEEWRACIVDASADDDGMDEDENHSSDDSESGLMLTSRRAEDIAPAEIQGAILQVLSKCPNNTCTLHSLTARVLKEIGVLTRGKPREAFERRTMLCVGNLEKGGHVEMYKAKNQRLRLIHQ